MMQTVKICLRKTRGKKHYILTNLYKPYNVIAIAKSYIELYQCVQALMTPYNRLTFLTRKEYEIDSKFNQLSVELNNSKNYTIKMAINDWNFYIPTQYSLNI
jgi:hypothetical protein